MERERGAGKARKENSPSLLTQHRVGHTPGNLSPCHRSGQASGLGWHPHLCIAPTADGPSPVWDVDAVWVPNQPVVILSEVGARVLGYGAIHIVEHRCLVPVHVQLVEPGPRLSEEHSGSNLKRAQENKAGPEGERKLQPSSGPGQSFQFPLTLQSSQTEAALGRWRKPHG